MIYFIGNTLAPYNNVQSCTLDYCINYLKTKKVIGIDIETSRKYRKNLYNESVYIPGLDPYVSKIVMLQIGDAENEFVIDVRCTNILPLKEILENSKILKVGHNLKFEGKHLYYNYGISLFNVWDTMVCERVLYNGYRISYSLENLAKRYLKAESLTKVFELFNSEENEEEEDIELDVVDAIDFKEKKFIINKSTRLEFINIEDKQIGRAHV